MTSSSATDSFAHLSERELLEALAPSQLDSQHRLEPVRMSELLVEALIAKYRAPEGKKLTGSKLSRTAIAFQKTLIETATELLVQESGAHPYERFILEGLNQRHEDPTCSTWVKAADRLAPTNRSHNCREALSALILKGLQHPDRATKKEALKALPYFMRALPDYSDRLGRAFGDCLTSLQMDVFLTAAQNSEAVIQAAPPLFLKSLKNRFNEITGQPAPAIEAQLEKALIKMGHHPAKPFRF